MSDDKAKGSSDLLSAQSFSADSALIENTVHSVVAWQGKFLKIQRDQVIMPNGRTSNREYILHPGAALVVPMISDHEVLMIRQYRHAVKKVFLEFPAGKKDPGEPSVVTARRELLEETGYECSDLRLMTTIHPVIGYADEHIDLYLGRGLNKKSEAQFDGDELLHAVTVPVSELPRLIREGQLSDVKTQIAAFWLDKILSSGW